MRCRPCRTPVRLCRRNPPFGLTRATPRRCSCGNRGCAMRRPVALLAMRRELPTQLFTADQWRQLNQLVDLATPEPVQDFADVPDRVLAEVEVVISGWKAPQMDAALVRRAPALRAIVHVAGTVKPYVDREVWYRGIAVTSCAAANAVATAEFTLGAILLSGKRIFEYACNYVADRAKTYKVNPPAWPWLGNYGRQVGIVGASWVGRRVIKLLQAHDMPVRLYDPYLSRAEADRLGVELAPDLVDLLSTCDIVSLHAPLTDETRGMVGASELAAMPDGSVLINTARGGLVDTEALTAELLTGRLTAVLDVTEPEPLPADSPLYKLAERGTVLLTPHVAGSLGGELHRMAEYALAELRCYTAGWPFHGAHLAENLDISA
ncbi:hydroxyacid dehydrogenase [Pseudonocardiaceae bacterium YIM PH 21723]|nr:hydroxyacid dehydrogenase [Pseudonocardiaceae bacterium YIM PH 21723]